jgi:hypothetical protein
MISGFCPNFIKKGGRRLISVSNLAAGQEEFYLDAENKSHKCLEIIGSRGLQVGDAGN